MHVIWVKIYYKYMIYYEELKNLLMKVKEESEKASIRLSIQKKKRLGIQKNEDHGIWSHYFMANRWVNNGNSDRLYFLELQKSLPMVTAVMK